MKDPRRNITPKPRTLTSFSEFLNLLQQRGDLIWSQKIDGVMVWFEIRKTPTSKYEFVALKVMCKRPNGTYTEMSIFISDELRLRLQAEFQQLMTVIADHLNEDAPEFYRRDKFRVFAEMVVDDEIQGKLGFHKAQGRLTSMKYDSAKHRYRPEIFNKVVFYIWGVQGMSAQNFYLMSQVMRSTWANLRSHFDAIEWNTERLRIVPCMVISDKRDVLYILRIMQEELYAEGGVLAYPGYKYDASTDKYNTDHLLKIKSTVDCEALVQKVDYVLDQGPRLMISIIRVLNKGLQNPDCDLTLLRMLQSEVYKTNVPLPWTPMPGQSVAVRVILWGFAVEIPRFVVLIGSSKCIVAKINQNIADLEAMQCDEDEEDDEDPDDSPESVIDLTGTSNQAAGRIIDLTVTSQRAGHSMIRRCAIGPFLWELNCNPPAFVLKMFALAMGLHKRLGRRSPLRLCNADVMRHILGYFKDEFDKLPLPRKVKPRNGDEGHLSYVVKLPFRYRDLHRRALDPQAESAMVFQFVLAMGTHKRLGSMSPLLQLDKPSILRDIARLAFADMLCKVPIPLGVSLSDLEKRENNVIHYEPWRLLPEYAGAGAGGAGAGGAGAGGAGAGGAVGGSKRQMPEWLGNAPKKTKSSTSVTHAVPVHNSPPAKKEKPMTVITKMVDDLLSEIRRQRPVVLNLKKDVELRTRNEYDVLSLYQSVDTHRDHPTLHQKETWMQNIRKMLQCLQGDGERLQQILKES